MAEEDKEPKAPGEEAERPAEEPETVEASPDEEPEEEPEGDEPDAGEGEETIPMTVAVEEEGPCRKTVKVEIPPERVTEDIQKGLDEIRTSVPMPGFRKGRVPKALLARRFGKKVKEDVRATLVREGMSQSIEKEGLRPFSLPDFGEEDLEAIEVEEGKPLVFSYTVDVKPDLAVDNYVGLEVKRPKVEVSEEEVEKEVDNLRRRRARVVPVEGGEVQPGDTLVVDREYTYRRKPVHKEENVTLPMPEEGSDLYEKMSSLKAFLGRKAGETVQTSFSFPETFPEASVRGKSGQQKTTVEDIKRLELPDLEGEFLEDLGVASAEALREKIREQVKAAKDSMADRIVEERLVDALLDRIPIDLPGNVVEREVEQYMKRYEVRLREQKVPEADIQEQIGRLREQRRKTVEKEFKAFFLLEEIAAKEKIFATEEEVDRRVEAMAVNYGKWPSQMREEMENAGIMDEVRNQVKEDKVKAFLREKAKIEEGEPLDLSAPPKEATGEEEAEEAGEAEEAEEAEQAGEA